MTTKRMAKEDPLLGMAHCVQAIDWRDQQAVARADGEIDHGISAVGGMAAFILADAVSVPWWNLPACNQRLLHCVHTLPSGTQGSELKKNAENRLRWLTIAMVSTTRVIPHAPPPDISNEWSHVLSSWATATMKQMAVLHRSNYEFNRDFKKTEAICKTSYRINAGRLPPLGGTLANLMQESDKSAFFAASRGGSYLALPGHADSQSLQAVLAKGECLQPTFLRAATQFVRRHPQQFNASDRSVFADVGASLLHGQTALPAAQLLSTLADQVSL